jgi:hypothetical protein
MQRCFKPEDGREEMADRTAHRACQKHVDVMIHEARLQAYVDYYRSIKKRAPQERWCKKGGADQGAIPSGMWIILIRFEI